MPKQATFWIEFPRGRRFECRRAGGSNRLFHRRLNQKMLPFADDIDDDGLDAEAQLSMLRRVYAETVVVNWSGILSDYNDELPYSIDAACSFFEQVPAVFDEIEIFASLLAESQDDDVRNACEQVGAWLTWAFEWGAKQSALEDMAEAGMDVPALNNRPKITGYGWLWSAYCDLVSCRQSGMTASTIPWTSVQQYADAHDYDVDDAYMLHRVVSHLETVSAERAQATAKIRSTPGAVRHR